MGERGRGNEMFTALHKKTAISQKLSYNFYKIPSFMTILYFEKKKVVYHYCIRCSVQTTGENPYEVTHSETRHVED